MDIEACHAFDGPRAGLGPCAAGLDKRGPKNPVPRPSTNFPKPVWQVGRDKSSNRARPPSKTLALNLRVRQWEALSLLAKSLLKIVQGGARQDRDDLVGGPEFENSRWGPDLLRSWLLMRQQPFLGSQSDDPMLQVAAPRQRRMCSTHPLWSGISLQGLHSSDVEKTRLMLL